MNKHKSSKHNSLTEIIRLKRHILILNRLIKLFTIIGIPVDNQLFFKLVLTHYRWVTCEGLSGMKRAKAFHLALVRGLMGLDYDTPFSNKYRRLLIRCLIFSRSSTLAPMLIISVSAFHRLLKLKPIVDTATITSSFKGSVYRCFVHYKALVHACDLLKRVGKVSDSWSAKWKWHISGKKGPNGGPSFNFFLEDLCANRKDWLYYKNLLLLYTLPVKNMQEATDTISKAYMEASERKHLYKKEPIHSRLAFLSDKAGKTRVVAIVDILSQSVLSIVHKRLFTVLKKFETDGTFDQDYQRSRVRAWSKENEFTSSIDLTAATDRIPVLYQTLVLILTQVLTWKQAIAWLIVIAWRPFTIERGKEIKYTVGQPMGALSSWPAMALAHHALVQWAHKVTYPESNDYFFNYALLGDDLVIKDEKVAETYLELINSLGIDYSPDKSFFANGRSEFAKSLFRSGEVLTPFPIAELDFTSKTVSNNTLSILSWFKTNNLKLTLSSLIGIFPTNRWRRLARLTSLSPVAPSNVLDVRPVDDFGLFYSTLWLKRVYYFSRRKTLQSTIYDFYQKNPIIGGFSPHYQIAEDNGIKYPVQGILERDDNPQKYALLGSSFVAYCTARNPNGIAPLGPSLVPLPSWVEERDDVLFTSSLLSTERMIPEFFTKRCVGPPYGK